MIEVVVTAIVEATPNIRHVSLTAVDGGPLPPFHAGAHIDVRLPNGLVRQYSLTGRPGDIGIYQLGILKQRNSRGGSQWLHEGLKENDRLHISEPRNLFPLVESARQHILFAGGIGVTPILSMARQLSFIGADFEVNYSVRSLAEAAFVADLAGLVPDGRLRLMARGRDAAREECLKALAAPAPGVHVYVCGPAGYIQAVLDLARRQGWPQAQLHTEIFGAAPASQAGRQAFSVHLARSGIRVRVAEDQSIVRALEEHGVHVPVSCEQGVCGTCLTRVVSGIPDHRDQYLTEEEQAANDLFTPCCSRAISSELVLDL